MTKRNWKKSALLGLASLGLCLLGTHAFAQDDDLGESREYNGGSFTIERPENWMLVSGNLGENELKALPKNVRDHYSLRNTDVIFMNIQQKDAKDKGFKDSLNIVTISEPIPLTKELVTEIETVLKQQYDAMFEKFTLTSAELTQLDGRDVLLVKGGYTVSNYSIKMEQVLVPSKKESYVLTCTYDSGKDQAEAILKSCLDAVKSLKFVD